MITGNINSPMPPTENFENPVISPAAYTIHISHDNSILPKETSA